MDGWAVISNGMAVGIKNAAVQVPVEEINISVEVETEVEINVEISNELNIAIEVC